MTILALALLALWLAALLLARSRTAGAPTPARRWNVGLLLATLVTGFSTCAAPMVRLLAGFAAVAHAAPEDKAAILSQAIDEARGAMLLSLVTIPVLILGIAAFVVNRRRIRQRQRERAVIEVF